jgi:uncharacterized protein YbjT (DUF2867 family)
MYQTSHNSFNVECEVSKLVTIISATGTQGQAVTRRMLERGWRVRAITRDDQAPIAKGLRDSGADVVSVEPTNVEDIAQAMAGSDGVFAALPSLVDQSNSAEATMGFALVDAIARAKVKHFVYSSALISNARGVLGLGTKRAIEERIAELDLPVTILRPAFFMENFEKYFPIKYEEDEFQFNAPIPLKTRLQIISVNDIAEAAATVMAEGEKYIGKSFDLIAEELSLEEMAMVWSKAHGKKVERTFSGSSATREFLALRRPIIYLDQQSRNRREQRRNFKAASSDN